MQWNNWLGGRSPFTEVTSAQRAAVSLLRMAKAPERTALSIFLTLMIAGLFVIQADGSETTGAGTHVLTKLGSEGATTSTRLREVRRQNTQPSLWLCGKACSLDFPRSNQLLVSWNIADRTGGHSTSAPRYVLLGNSLEDYAKILGDSKEPTTLRQWLFLGEDGSPLISPMTNDVLFLPSPKFIAASVSRGRELLAQNTQGIVFRVPHVPATSDTLAQLATFTAAQSNSTPTDILTYEQRLRTEAYDACLLAVDRFVHGLRDLAHRKGFAQAKVWLATSSLPVSAFYQCITPFFGLNETTHPDGIVVFIHPLKDDVLQALPTALRPTSFEWCLFQVSAGHAAAELLNCALVFAPLEDGSTSHTLTIETMIAAQLVGSSASTLALGAATLPTVMSDFDNAEMTLDALCDDQLRVWSMLGNLLTSQKEGRVRWDSGSRDVAIAIDDGLLMQKRSGTLGEFLALWLPCLHEGLPVRLISLASLAEPRISRNVRTVITSFSFQNPRRADLIALAEWVRQGGALVLFAEGNAGSRVWDYPNDNSLVSAGRTTTVSAEASFLSYLGLPSVISDGTYRVGDGWVFYSSRTLGKIIATSEYGQVPRALGQVAQATRRPIISRPVWAVYRDDVVAGAYIARELLQERALKGTFVDLTTYSLSIVRNPSYRQGDVFLVREIRHGAARSVRFLAANVPLLSTNSSVGLWNFQKVGTGPNCPAALQSVFFAPSLSYAVEDADTGEGLNFEYSQVDGILRVFLCPETANVVISPIP